MKLLPSLLFIASIAASSASIAQPVVSPMAPARNANAQAIPPDLLQKFIAITAINGCMLLQEKVDYKTILKAGIASVAGVIYTDYGSKISNINGDKPLDDQQLGNGIGIDLSLQISGRCEKLVPEEDLKKIKEFIQSNSSKK